MRRRYNDRMAENLFSKLVRALPVASQQGWGGMIRYLKTSTSPQGARPLPGPTDSDVLAADQRIRRRMAAPAAAPAMAGQNRSAGPARLTMPTLIGL